jgi:acetyl esterase
MSDLAMPLDPEALPIMEMLDAVFPRAEGPNADAVDFQTRAALIPGGEPTEELATIEDRAIPGPAGDIPIRIYVPEAATTGSAPGIVYFHGGGWVICGLDTHDSGCRRLANEIGAVVVSVDYRLAPQHRYPAAIDDAYAATVWTADHVAELGIDPDRLAIAGDSAGGNLTAAVALKARDLGTPALVFQLMIYPVIDSTAKRNDYPSKKENAVGFFLTTDQMDWYRNQYVTSDAASDEPYCSPNRAASLAGLPPACIVTAEMDPLRDEAEEYARLLTDAGVDVTLYRADGMFHGFFNMDAVGLTGASKAQAVAFDATRAVLTPN